MLLPPSQSAINKLKSIIKEQIGPSTGPLIFTTSLESAKGNVVDNGSYSLVCTNQKWLLVTCYHVWAGFVEQRKKNSELKLCASFGQKHPIQICTLTDGTKLEPIDYDIELDIATFDMTPFLDGCSEKLFAVLNNDESNRIEVENIVAIVGYPGVHRLDTAEGLFFGREPFVLKVSKIISGCKFRVDLTRAMSEDRQITVTETNKEKRLGGISGAPCFCFTKALQPVLAGFVNTHVYTKGEPENSLQITVSHCINENGTIKPASSFYN